MGDVHIPISIRYLPFLYEKNFNFENFSFFSLTYVYIINIFIYICKPFIWMDLVIEKIKEEQEIEENKSPP